MSAGVDRVEAFLAHYASEYYDPAKAHEYYLKNRDLKGRSTSGMSDSQKEGWSYAKSKMAESQKADVAAASSDQKATVEKARAAAQATREDIANKLRAMMQSITDKRAAATENLSTDQKSALEKLAADQKAKSADIREAAAQKIAAVPPIPEGVSDEQRAQLAARRAEKIAAINGSAWNDLVSLAAKSEADHNAVLQGTKDKRQAISDSANAQKESARTDSTSSREALSAGLKATVDKARADYDARKEQIKADYEAAAQREYDGIKANLPSAPAKAKAGSKKGSSKKDKKALPKAPGVKSMSLQEAAKAALTRQKTP